ncbi:MAG: L-serine ammonia-lyase, iron-sulfur-dependent, subunit beta [Angelakisella sp.]|nr:L-serine ammonia-lyase, iron-sulfur-dependent, subunit beta [Angelakisella sp.]
MKDFSLFDIIGPNMIGPSSSHTAGALRIAQLARGMLPGPIVQANFTLYGSFARTYQGHGTDRALIAGVLGFSTEDSRIRDSFQWAEKMGLRYRFTLNTQEKDCHPNTVQLLLTNQQSETATVTGVSVGGGAAVITRINGVEIDLTGDYHTILVRQQDTPGVVAAITSALSEHQINIAFMRLYREARGSLAYTIIEADEAIPPAAVAQIHAHPSIQSALLIPRIGA